MYWLELLTGPIALVGWSMVAISIALFRRQRSGVTTIVAIVTTIIYFVISTPITTNMLVGVLEQADTEGRACGAPTANSVIVVLAGGVLGSPRSADDYERLQVASLRRTMAGVRLALLAPGSRLLLSGGAGHRAREADLMRTLALDMGMPAKRIVLDRNSRSTYESAKAVAELLKTKLKSDSVFLVTSAIHMPRAAATFVHQGVDICTYPVDWQWMNPPLYTVLIPQISALRKSSAALHEMLGYAWYWMTGRL
ncbi:MAG: YdcF family protein [Acidiferrobacteraceae bacterium]